jgi:hypothetical protein
VTGRGAWNNSGVGGTKKFRSFEPGPYYYIGTGYRLADKPRDANETAVWEAVKVYQRRLNQFMGTKLLVDGLYGDKTANVVSRYQELKAKTDDTVVVWGGIGPETSEMLLAPMVAHFSKTPYSKQIHHYYVYGLIRKESNWDAGAVGRADERDVGMVQINAEAHPQWTTPQRIDPITCYKFVYDYWTESLAQLNNNLRDAVASYNLGVGGARKWIAAGRPDIWSPTPTSAPRNVKKYIDDILAG